MSTITLIQDLYRHMEWADSTVWAAVHGTPGVAEDRRTRELLCHIHMVQRAFLALWRGEPVQPRGLDDFENLAAIETWGRDYYPLAFEFIGSVQEEGLARIQPIPWAANLEKLFGRIPQPVAVVDTMVQVASHSTYHRGQVNMKLRELGGQPPLVDFIAWHWFGRPAPVWPGAELNSR